MVPVPSSPDRPLPVGAAVGHRTRKALTAAVALGLMTLLLTGPGPAASAQGAAVDEADTETDAAAESTDAGDPEADAAAEAEADRLREGQQVYSQICSACHQSGGTGLEGQFPPLVGSPRIDDAAYVAEVIENGLQGEIVVDGVTYDGVMPSFSTLTDEEVAAVTAFIQNDFVAPPDAGEEAFGDTGPVAGTELPALTNMGMFVAFALAALVIGLVLAPRLTSANDRLDMPWLDAWLKTAAIVAAVFLLTIWIPNWALQQGAVGRLSRFGQDLIGTGLWTLGVGILLGALWYAHRESRV